MTPFVINMLQAMKGQLRHFKNSITFASSPQTLNPLVKSLVINNMHKSFYPDSKSTER